MSPQLQDSPPLPPDAQARFGILDAAPNGFAALDRDWRYVYVNKAGAQLIGKTPAELIGGVIWEIFPDIVGGPLWSIFHKAMGGETVESEFRYAPMDFWHSILAYPIETGIAVEYSNVTAQKRPLPQGVDISKHQESRITEQRLQAAVQFFQIGVFDHDHEAGTIYWSPEQRQISGFSPDEPTTLRAFMNIRYQPDVERVDAAVARAHDPSGDGYLDVEYRIIRRDAEIRALKTRSKTIFAGEGSERHPVRTLGAVIDITDRLNAEEALHRLNAGLEERIRERTAQLEVANKELNAFTYAVSHDLKAPLRSIEGYSRLVLEDYGDQLQGEAAQFLQSVRLAAIKMGQLINDLLSYSKMEHNGIISEEIDLPALIANLLTEFASEIDERDVTVTVDLPSACVIAADRRGLSMALRNLLENAIKFSGKAARPQIEIAGRQEGSYFVLSVRDNGVGFDMRYHDQIFGIFQRLQRAEDFPGTGVGLAIVRKAMERIGGQTWAEGELGRGATFFLRIPN